MIKKFPLAGAASVILATLFMVSPSHAQSLAASPSTDFPTIIQIAPPSNQQAAATARAAALEVKTLDPNRTTTERLGREMAVKDGTTLEANLFLNGHVKGNVPLEELDKAMGWPLGTMSQWKAGRWENRAGELEQSAMWRYAKTHNMTTKQLDDAVGWTPGTLDNWAVQNGLMPAPRGSTLAKAPATSPPTASTTRKAAIRIKEEQERLSLKNTIVKQDSPLASKKVDASDRAVGQPKSKPNVCELNPGRFKGCSVF